MWYASIQFYAEISPCFVRSEWKIDNFKISKTPSDSTCFRQLLGSNSIIYHFSCCPFYTKEAAEEYVRSFEYDPISIRGSRLA